MEPVPYLIVSIIVMIPIILLKAFEVYEAKNQTDLAPGVAQGLLS